MCAFIRVSIRMLWMSVLYEKEKKTEILVLGPLWLDGQLATSSSRRDRMSTY